MDSTMDSTMMIAVMDSAVRYLQAGDDRPATEDVVSALIAAEKQNKRSNKRLYQYEQFLGSWRLGFVSGTQKVRPRPASTPVTKPGKGRFLPRFLKVEITYTSDEDRAAELFGTVENAVTIGPISLRLSGPTRFWPNTNSLGFDFTALQARLGGLPLYTGSIRGGIERNQIFKAQSLKDQAFFTFFIVEPDYIAARGKGGGLALWIRQL